MSEMVTEAEMPVVDEHRQHRINKWRTLMGVATAGVSALVYGEIIVDATSEKDPVFVYADVEERLDEIVDEQVGHDVRVDCLRLITDQDGSIRKYAQFGHDSENGEPVIQLDFVICDIFNNPERTALIDKLLSLYFVAHELAHAQGTMPEGEANCAAAPNMYPLADALDIELPDGFDSLEFIKSISQPPEYHDAGC